VGFFLIDLRELIEGMRKASNTFFEQIKFRLDYLIDMVDDRIFGAWVVMQSLNK
jgi:hypothetical protein